MRLPLFRYGRSGGAIAVVLFLLSCLLVLPALWWTMERRSNRSSPRDYQFSPEATMDTPPDSKQVGPQGSDLTIKSWHHVADMGVDLAQFETVFWELKDTDSLRSWIAKSSELQGARVLEVGTGTGLVAICCALHEAAQVVATDINPNAYANALYNAEHLGLEAIIEVRLVSADSPGAFSVVRPEEQFDLILSNPPWEDSPISEVAAYALYDPGFQLLDGLLTQAGRHLRPQGKLLLAYGARAAIRRILEQAPQHGWRVQIRDDRELDELPEVFLPAMLIELDRP